jgi:epoxyqueuosine reductase QueG
MRKKDLSPSAAADWVREGIETYAASAENRLRPDGGAEPAWAKPLVGFSRGDDPLYDFFKAQIGPFYWTPAEIFAAAFQDQPVAPAELTVISWVLPQTAATRRDNARERSLPAERWCYSRKYGEEFNGRLRDHVVGFLAAAGHPAVAPMRSPLWKKATSERYGFASSWSERHAAYASGLGTFGLCDGLITPVGKAMRCGSAVARIAAAPTARPYADHHAYCLFYVDGSCGKCIKRCPVGAVSTAGHDKQACAAYVQQVGGPSVRERFGFEIDACGLCQTGVPCAARIPVPGFDGRDRT